MKKRLYGVLIALAILMISLSVIRLAPGNAPDDGPSSMEPGSTTVHGQLCIWDGEENGAVGVYAPDGTLSVAWIDQRLTGEVLLQTSVPADLVARAPTTEDGRVDLQDVIGNAETLGLEVSVIARLDPTGKPPKPSMDPVERNGIRLCVDPEHNTDPYDAEKILTAAQYSPVLIDVFETKTLNIRKSKIWDNCLKQGWDPAAVIAALVGLSDLPPGVVAQYADEALAFSGGVLAWDVSIGEAEVGIRYLRSAGYRATDSASVTMCPDVEEEHALFYRVWLTFQDSDEPITDFADITHLMGAPTESYLNSERSFSTDSIVAQAYEHYQSTH